MTFDQEQIAAVAEMLDRQKILECVHRYARALDRHDDELLRSCFHEDAIDHHGRWRGRRDDFVQWANHQTHGHLASHMHHITSHNCELNGSEAHAESYVLFIHRLADGKTVRVGGGRYVDRFEKRNCEWRILARRLIMDVRFAADGSIFGDQDGYEKGVWTRDDPSYRRPLTIDLP